jgi:hypothetical protein
VTPITCLAVRLRARHALPFALAVVGLAGSLRAEARVSISGSPPTTDVVGQQYIFTPTATDTRNRTLYYQISNKPTWASFSTSTGTLSGTPSSSNVGTTSNITITVSDGHSKAQLSPFSLTVTSGATSTPAPTPTTGSATVTWTAPTQNTDGTALTNLAGYKIAYGTSSSSLSNSVQVANSGATSYTLSSLASGTWYFAVLAYTNSGAQSALSAVTSKTVP